MTDIMVDLETLGNGKNACVTQIGSCYFDRYTGEITRTFFCNVDARSAMRSGAEMDAATVYWWLNQDKGAIDAMIKPPLDDITVAFTALNEFMRGAKNIWSHATFDFVILQETYKRLNIKPSFRYTYARDIRTLVDLSGIILNYTKREGVHHNALDDCLHQVKYCVEAFNKLKGKVDANS